MQTLQETQPSASALTPLIDCDVHITVPNVQALFPYLPQHWVEHVNQSVFKGPSATYYPPRSPVAARPDSVPPDGPAGSSLDLLRRAGARSARLSRSPSPTACTPSTACTTRTPPSPSPAP